jgi:hypothetical protein
MIASTPRIVLVAATAGWLLTSVPPAAAQIGVPPPMPPVPLPAPIPPPKIEIPPIPKLDQPQPTPRANLGSQRSFGSKVSQCRDEAIALGLGRRARESYSLSCAHRD